MDVVTRAGITTKSLKLARPIASIPAAELEFGQPVYETHPHLLKPGERECAACNYLEMSDLDCQ